MSLLRDGKKSYFSKNQIANAFIANKKRFQKFVKQYFDEVKPCLKYIINDLKNLIHGKFS